MRVIPFAILLLFISYDIDCKDKFDIINATAQNWVGGRPETGKGIYYELTIEAKVSSENLIFDQIWIAKDLFNIQCYQKGKKVKNNTFGAGDTITITVNKHIGRIPKSFIEKDVNEVNSLPPFEYKGEALLSYIYKSKRKYITIESFKKLEDLRYP